MNTLTMNVPTMPRCAVRRRTSSNATPHPGLLERAFTAVVVFLSTGGVLPLLRLEGGGVAVDELEGDLVMQIIWLAVYGVTLLLLAARANWRFNLAKVSAACAAPPPLSSPPALARILACASVSTVRMPLPTGMLSESEMSIRPRADSPATIS